MRRRHTARVQRPHGLTPVGEDTLAHTDTLAYHTDTLAHHTDTLAHKGLDNDVTDTSCKPSRAGRGIVALLRGFLAGLGRAGRESGALVPELPACLGYWPLAREPGKKKKKEDKTLNIQNVQSLLCSGDSGC